jgi:xanthine dehydrogenase accessory factor
MSCTIKQLDQLNAAIKARQPVILATYIDGGKTLVIQPGHTGELADQCEKCFLTGKSTLIRLDKAGEVFLNVYTPAPRLIIIGAVHITQALASLAHVTGLDTIIIDPRSAFATSARFPLCTVYDRWPDEILPEIKLDSFTAVAAISHDPKIDDFPLIEALHAGCFYVGALGSRKTHLRRLQRLREAGVAEDLLTQIHAPIGLNIGAVGPEEIAVAILAEVINSLRGPKRSTDA